MNKPKSHKPSWEFNDLAWKIEIPLKKHPAYKLVLVFLGQHANDKGRSWHSIPSIAQMTGLSERAISEATVYLTDTLHILRFHRKGFGGGNVYELQLEAMQKLWFEQVCRRYEKNLTLHLKLIIQAQNAGMKPVERPVALTPSISAQNAAHTCTECMVNHQVTNTSQLVTKSSPLVSSVPLVPVSLLVPVSRSGLKTDATSLTNYRARLAYTKRKLRDYELYGTPLDQDDIARHGVPVEEAKRAMMEEKGMVTVSQTSWNRSNERK